MAPNRAETDAVRAVAVSSDLPALLPGTGFSDAYRVIAPAALTAPQAADAVFGRPPAWIGRLLALRDRMVAPFGLKVAAGEGFPVLASDDRRVVLGLDDSHLDFRIVVEVEAHPSGGTQVTLTTLVRRNNLLGRVYLTAIMPFHRLIARTMVGSLRGAS